MIGRACVSVHGCSEFKGKERIEILLNNVLLLHCLQSFSLSICRQLALLVNLFSVCEVYSHIRPIAFVLSDDHVAEVRHASTKAVSITYQILFLHRLVC
jgi:hypothetical protein